MILQTTIMPEQASELAWDIDNIIWAVSLITGVTGLGVYIAIAVFCIAYRRKVPGELGYAPTPRILGSHKLELAWTLIPMVIFLCFFGWGAWVYNKALHPPPNVPEIYIVGKQWMWKVQYPEGQRIILGQNSLDYSDDVGGRGYFEGVMVLQVDRPVRIVTTSEDVIHDFGVPAFRQKIDAVPGRYTSTWYRPTKIGTYDIFCDQYCGTNHSLMVGKIMVVSAEDYEAWIKGYWKLRPDTNAVDGSLAHQGRQLFQKLNCIQCHDTDKSRAPVLEEIYDTERPIKGGRMARADHSYLWESIRRPRAKIRDGWEPIMPAFGPDKVSEDDLVKVIAYLRSLRKGETPKRTEDWVAPVGAPTETTPTPKTSTGDGGSK